MNMYIYTHQYITMQLCLRRMPSMKAPVPSTNKRQ